MEIFLNIFLLFCIFIIGTLFGSFYSLATFRLPIKQDIIATRSYCTSCKHRLNFFDLIPIFSYLFCSSKCRYCHEKISMRYFLLELCTGIVALLLYYISYMIFGFTFSSLILFMIFIIVYSIIFVIIGSKVMKKYHYEENNIDGEIKLSRKSGVFLSELIIAMILFVILISTSLVISRNYNKSIEEIKFRGNALSIAVKNIELALLTKYENLDDFNQTEVIDNITYHINVEVLKYSEENSLKEDLVKKVNVKVSYMVSGKNYEILIKTLKGKV